MYETLSDSPPKKVAPEATSTIALSLMMILTLTAAQLAGWPRGFNGSIILDGTDGVHPQLGASLQVQGARAVSKRLDGRTTTGAGRAAEHCPVSHAHGLDGGSIPGIAHTEE